MTYRPISRIMGHTQQKPYKEAIQWHANLRKVKGRRVRSAPRRAYLPRLAAGKTQLLKVPTSQPRKSAITDASSAGSECNHATAHRDRSRRNEDLHAPPHTTSLQGCNPRPHKEPFAVRKSRSNHHGIDRRMAQGQRAHDWRWDRERTMTKTNSSLPYPFPLKYFQ